MKNLSISFIVNTGLLISALATVCSGFLIQIHYHMGNHGDINTNNIVWGLNHSQWSLSHKISIVILSSFMAYHFISHLKWFNVIICKNLIAKNRQVFILSFVFIIAAITGYIPWFLKLTDSEETTRKIFIEIHDKIGLVLIVFLVLHTFKRAQWFITTFKKIKT